MKNLSLNVKLLYYIFIKMDNKRDGRMTKQMEDNKKNRKIGYKCLINNQLIYSFFLNKIQFDIILCR